MITHKNSLEVITKSLQYRYNQATTEKEAVITFAIQDKALVWFDIIISRILLAASLRNNIDTLLPIGAESKTYIHLLRTTEATLAEYEVQIPDNEVYDYPSIELQADILAYKLSDNQFVKCFRKELTEQNYNNYICPNSTLIKCSSFLKIYV